MCAQKETFEGYVVRLYRYFSVSFACNAMRLRKQESDMAMLYLRKTDSLRLFFAHKSIPFSCPKVHPPLSVAATEGSLPFGFAGLGNYTLTTSLHLLHSVTVFFFSVS